MDKLSALSTDAFNFNGLITDRSPNVNHVHELILDRLENVDASLSDAAFYHFKTPGKMLRAKMAMQSASLAKIDISISLLWAASVEVLHNASLIHDDICDGDKQRRGRASIWIKFGRDTALTLGDWLIALSFELASEAAEMSNTPRLVGILARHMATTTAGQAMEFKWDSTQSWDVYLKIAADKTAPLLTAPIHGVTLMSGTSGLGFAISGYFCDLGKAYQIANDILNFKGTDGAKLIAGDLARRAPNAVTVSFVESLNDHEHNEFKDWYNNSNNEDLKFWRDKILASRAIETASVRMLKIINAAECNINTLPSSAMEAVVPVHTIIKRVCALSI
ncbi:polyprenyl synthetase family protein [Amylibacter sp.]|mgnify:FL=1|jgi:geranylgeranyl pyrophosphate synthase|nr:polyprenyl synthetase family protein [Amylibacter sp.]MDB9877411.1 polyprenyl synthetase family protein [Amylibacter sp.]|tara:strand:- start:15256 stop:16260 length:1005 start_codon:yes stop_codon:yes gene_type:complete